MIYAAARGSKQLWVVPGAYHTAALGFQPEEFRRRVLSFFATYAKTAAPPAASVSGAKGRINTEDAEAEKHREHGESAEGVETMEKEKEGRGVG